MQNPYPECTSGMATECATTPGKCRHVGDLLHRRQEPSRIAPFHGSLELVEQQPVQLVVHVDDAGHPHVGHEALPYPVVIRAQPLDERHLLSCGSGGREVRRPVSESNDRRSTAGEPVGKTPGTSASRIVCVVWRTSSYVRGPASPAPTSPALSTFIPTIAVCVHASDEKGTSFGTGSATRKKTAMESSCGTPERILAHIASISIAIDGRSLSTAGPDGSVTDDELVPLLRRLQTGIINLQSNSGARALAPGVREAFVNLYHPLFFGAACCECTAARVTYLACLQDAGEDEPDGVPRRLAQVTRGRCAFRRET